MANIIITMLVIKDAIENIKAYSLFLDFNALYTFQEIKKEIKAITNKVNSTREIDINFY